MFDFITHLFDTSSFPRRWDCGAWTAGQGWLHICSDLGVWSAYVAIPCVLLYFLLRRKDIPFRGVFVLFGAFILACGTTHLMEAIIFWWPAYRLAGVIKLFTALISWVTVIALIPVAPKVLAMRTPDEMEREIMGRKKAEAALQRINAELEIRVQNRTADLLKVNESLQAEIEERKRVAEALRSPRPETWWTGKSSRWCGSLTTYWMSPASRAERSIFAKNASSSPPWSTAPSKRWARSLRLPIMS